MTPTEIEAALRRAYQIGRLEVVGEVNIQRVRTLKERFERLEAQLELTPDLLPKALRLRKQIVRACEIGLRNETALKELMEQ